MVLGSFIPTLQLLQIPSKDGPYNFLEQRDTLPVRAGLDSSFSLSVCAYTCPKVEKDLTLGNATIAHVEGTPP